MGERATTVKVFANRSAEASLPAGRFHSPFQTILALIALIHFTLAAEIHQLSHAQSATAPSTCNHESCTAEKLPTEKTDSSSSSECKTCKTLASTHGDLLHVQILLSSPAYEVLQVPSDLTLIDSRVKKERPGRSPPRA